MVEFVQITQCPHYTQLLDRAESTPLVLGVADLSLSTDDEFTLVTISGNQSSNEDEDILNKDAE
jgi:hypothetical protein